MAGVDNVLFSEILLNIKEEEFKGDVYLDDKVLITETAINTNYTELNEYKRGDEMKLDLLSTDIKLESSLGDIKVKFNNKLLFCNNCNEYYEEYCTKCGMLICILNGNGLNNRAKKEIPADILEIKEGLFGGTGIFALKTIPKGVKFGPFTGFSAVESSWRLKRGKFVVGDNKLEFLNWMQYINCARSVFDQNLIAFQYDDHLYYSSVCEIQEGEELLVYFGEEYEESLNKGIEMDFIPHIEVDAQNVFACTYCCLGFSLKVHLVEHKTICPNGTNGSFEELVQCPFCKIYLEKEEYLGCHKICCYKGNGRHFVLPELDDHTLEEKIIPPVINKHEEFKLTQLKYVGEPKNHIDRHYEVEMFRCETCYKRFKNEESLELHMQNIHTTIKQKHSIDDYLKVNKNTEGKTSNSHPQGKQFKCLKCKFETNRKFYLKSHMKTKHLNEYDYNCMECEYKTNYKFKLKAHLKSKHFKEYDFNCMECEFKTNCKSRLEEHIKTKHLKEYDYTCMECEYRTNDKSRFEIHVKTQHLKEYDYTCVECEFKTNCKSKSEEHVKTKHLKEYDYNCTKCEYKTNYKFKLQAHLKTKHFKEYDYNCTECEYKTNHKSRLEIHVKSKHLKEFDYSCMECEYKTNHRSRLEVHVKTQHLKEYDYKCVECEYKTNDKRNFQAHMKAKHVKEYNFNCMECKYKTNDKSRLETHVKTKHLQEYDYYCMECDYMTNTKSNLQRHMKTKHLSRK